MTEKEEDKIYMLIEEFHCASITLGQEAESDGNHGGGINTKEERDDFIQHFGKLVNKVKSQYDNVCAELNKIEG